jgi:tellurite resistance protein
MRLHVVLLLLPAAGCHHSETPGLTMSLVLNAAQQQPRPSMKARLLTEAEQTALISCEQGARISQEASGIHYYLRRARNDPTNTVLRNSCVERPKQMVDTASLEGKAGAARIAEDAGGKHDAEMRPGVVVAVPLVGAETAGTLGTVKVC